MLVYFEFEEKRRKADVSWPKDGQNIIVHITDLELARQFPTDLLYDIENENRVVFTIEDPANKQLLELQNVIKRRLQELCK